MAKVKVELNGDGVRALLKSSEMRSAVESAAQERARRAGNGYAVRTHDTASRAIANVYADTENARRDNLENNTLLKVLQ